MKWPLYFLGLIIGMVGYGIIDESFLREVITCFTFSASGICVWEAVKGKL